MRAYKFLNEEFGIKSLRERRLKQSRVNELNDPFELTPFDLTDPAIRNTFFQTREDLSKEKGVVCFSSGWRDPVIWAHYSDKHRGLCLGFEIPNPKEEVDDESGCVRYIEKPLHFPADFSELGDTERFEIIRKILFTKFINWEYEHEIRLWAPLAREEDGLHFLEFNETLRIVEVIIGARCALPRSEITQALGALASDVTIITADVAYDRFEMVKSDGRE
jgi:hypothetical protein